MKPQPILTFLIISLLTIALWAGWSLDQAPATEPPAQARSLAGDDFQGRLPGLLHESWDFYKGRFLVDGTHVVSNTYGGTISEGQSYALLKAVWMNDPAVFERVWRWTKTNMKRPHDALLGWRWDETKGLIGIDNAADADQDIAYALLLAGERWQRPDYIRDGRAIVRDLWRLNVQAVNSRYYLVPGTWEGFRWEYLTIDPSYFAPYVYRKFAKHDPANAEGWRKLADDIYDTLDACTALTKPRLPPNWCTVRYDPPASKNASSTGTAGRSAVPGKPGLGGKKPLVIGSFEASLISKPTLSNDLRSRITFSDRQGEGARDFSYDAFRVYWRMAMDAALSPSPGKERAMAYLQKHPFLLNYWHQHHLIPEGFTADGTPRGTENSGFAMGPLLVLNHVRRPQADAPLYQATLAPYYHTDGYWFNDYNDFLHSVIWLHLYAMSLK